MKEKTYEMTILFDFYGDILTEKQQELFDLYYNEDLSLGEIAEHLGITRQGVRDGIVRAEQIITEFESKLGLAAKFGRLSDNVRCIVNAAEKIALINDTNYRNTELSDAADEILKHAAQLAE